MAHEISGQLDNDRRPNISRSADQLKFPRSEAEFARLSAFQRSELSVVVHWAGRSPEEVENEGWMLEMSGCRVKKFVEWRVSEALERGAGQTAESHENLSTN